jgi:hypothetical protein
MLLFCEEFFGGGAGLKVGGRFQLSIELERGEAVAHHQVGNELILAGHGSLLVSLPARVR